jgi:putative membrane protein insertion efficiency factor
MTAFRLRKTVIRTEAIITMIKKLLVSGIKAYQCLSRALFLRNCRFYPSCSQYAIEAIERHGPVKGLIKAAGRILRCSPASDGGHDPVR